MLRHILKTPEFFIEKIGENINLHIYEHNIQ